jgi:protein ImuB
MEPGYPIELLEPLTFILARMLDRLCLRLETRGMAAHETALHLGLEKRAVFTRILKLPFPVRQPRLMLKLFMLDLQAHPPGGAVVRITVEARHSRPRVIQSGLFAPLSPEPGKLELTLARIAGIVGEDNVGTPEIPDTRQPQAFRMTRFSIGENRGSPYFPPRLPPRLPLHIFRPPLEATVRIRGGVPAWIAFSGVHGPVRTASGPWRCAGGWWRPAAWNRDEWDIEVFPSGLYRIYMEYKNYNWFVEGAYD